MMKLSPPSRFIMTIVPRLNFIFNLSRSQKIRLEVKTTVPMNIYYLYLSVYPEPFTPYKIQFYDTSTISNSL